MNFTIKPSPYTVSEDYKKFVLLNNSNHSYATNNKITAVLNKDSWLGRRCFVVGSGPSLAGFDFSLLKNELTIGINKAFLINTFTINYAMDSNFYRGIFDGLYDKQEGCRIAEKWLAYTGLKIFLTPMELNKYGNEVYLVKRTHKPGINRTDLDEGIWGGENSAVGAINLAIALGANPIYLLGYDMHCGEKTHYHKGYVDMGQENGQPKVVDRDPVIFNNQLQKYKAEVEETAKLWKEHNIAIFNLGPDSALECFPSADLNRVLGA